MADIGCALHMSALTQSGHWPLLPRKADHLRRLFDSQAEIFLSPFAHQWQSRSVTITVKSD